VNVAAPQHLLTWRVRVWFDGVDDGLTAPDHTRVLPNYHQAMSTAENWQASCFVKLEAINVLGHALLINVRRNGTWLL
jgi:hypothetical protein